MSFVTSIKAIIKDCVVKLNEKNSNDFWIKSTYDEYGNELTYKDSNVQWKKSSYNENGEILDFSCSIDTAEITNII